MPAPHNASAAESRTVIVLTLWIAVVTGLVEGAGSVLLMRLGQLPGAWWDLLWASPLFDLVMYGSAGLVLTFVARRFGRPATDFVLPAYGFLTASIWLGLALPYQVHIAALLLLSAGIGFQGARVAKRHLTSVARFCRRTLPVVLGAAGLAFVLLPVGRPVRERIQTARLPSAAAGAPNVVLIVVDALRADHLSTHGYHRDTSPTLARLASEGASFRSAFSTSPYTAPSHASLLTGLYPSEHGAQWIERRAVLRDDAPTIAEALSASGYRTAAISGNRFWFTREQRFGRGFLRFEDNYRSLGDAVIRTAYGRKIEEWLLRRIFEDYPWRLKAAAVTDDALSWVGERRDRPFFLMLNYFDVHDPYFPPDPYRSRFAKVPEPGGILNSYQDRYHPDLTPEQLQEEIDAYDGAITYVDEQIARLLEGLEAAGAAENLLVIVTADHGEAFGEHGAYIHANALYLEEIHVPLILWSPGRVPNRFESDVPVSNVTVPATILDLVGAPEERVFRGPSLASLWSSDALTESPWPVSEMEHWPWNLETSPSHYGGIRSIVSPEYHYIRNDSLGEELYRWRLDPAERSNLLAEDRMRAVADEMESALTTQLSVTVPMRR